MTGKYALSAVTPSRLDTIEDAIPTETALTGTALAHNSGGMRTADMITRKLTEALAPHSLDVVDESHHHEGHAGHRPGGQTHFRVYIVSDAFKGKTRIERHRMINSILADQLAGGIHALAIHAAAPGEGGAG